MRHVIWRALLAAFTQAIPVAYAQALSGTTDGTYNAGPVGAPPPGVISDDLNGTNRGIPGDPKPWWPDSAQGNESLCQT